MFGLPHDAGRTEPLHILALGAHSDDVEIGAAGTLHRLVTERPEARVTVVVLSGSPARASEARAGAEALLGDRVTVRTETFRDGFFPHEGEALKDCFRDLQPLRPDLVLAHRLDDAHQDHRAVGELAWQTFRGARIAAYEIPKWEGDLGRPNAYVRLGADAVERKLAVLRERFPSQAGKPWYDEEAFRSLLRLRGVECGARYAEAFHCDKLVW